ncbi:PEPxxWA-CTERM sorting domain-containing protein [Parasphingorhabdus sp.]|uniref:PEPxxWA-CTERM sorting domain-containing protein n=1 Tax=Parasphingorhabdus sp. TaxID=2709688 RepID=UPI003262D4EA
MKKFLLTAAAAIGTTTMAMPAQAVVIDFEGTGASCCFGAAPLTDLYSGLGVTFDGVGGDPGTILNQTGNFGVDARSGTDFLAYNDGVGTNDGRLIFSSAVSDFSIYAGGGRGDGVFSADFFDSANNLLGSQTVNVTLGNYGLLSYAGPVSFVNISSDQAFWVLDDLSFNAAAVPEPATWAFMIFGFGAIGGAMRRQRKANVKVSYA